MLVCLPQWNLSILFHQGPEVSLLWPALSTFHQALAFPLILHLDSQDSDIEHNKQSGVVVLL